MSKEQSETMDIENNGNKQSDSNIMSPAVKKMKVDETEL